MVYCTSTVFVGVEETGGLHEMRAKVTEALIAGADSIIIAGALSTELGHMTAGQSRPAHRSGSGGSFL